MRVALLDDFSPLIQQTLSNWNWQVINGKNWSLKDYKKNASQLEGIIIRSKFPLSKEHLLMAKKLKFIGRPWMNKFPSLLSTNKVAFKMFLGSISISLMILVY